MNHYDAVIIGSGPNGLSAGIYLAEKGWQVLIIEGADVVGGGMRTAELTLPGFQHDVCSAVHPMGYLSPYFKTLPLENYGLEWVFPEASVAHPLDNDSAVLLLKSIEQTAAQFGDKQPYASLIEHFADRADDLFTDALKPAGFPSHPALMARFGSKAILSANMYSRLFLKDKKLKALFAGCAAHSILPFDKLLTAALGIIFLVSGHKVNWPMPKGGSQSLANALHDYYVAKGGKILLSTRIKRFKELPESRVYLFDTDPLQLADICADQLPERYRNKLKKYNFGPGVFKIDYALSEPVPWKDPRCLKASTVHLGGTYEAIASAEKQTWDGKHPDQPYVLLTQQSQFDNSRAPKGKHTGWAYCHVPFGSNKDMTDVIERQIERFAPGFRDTVLARHTMNSEAFELYNPNYAGGAVTGGAADITQAFTRPVFRLNPYSTPNPKIYICSASTPPGGGVHGMCGYWAAKSVAEKISI